MVTDLQVLTTALYALTVIGLYVLHKRNNRSINVALLALVALQSWLIRG